MKEDLITTIKETFGVEPTYICVGTFNQFADNIKRERTIKMINDVESIVNDFDNENNNPAINVANVGIALFNIINFDSEDAKLVGVKDVQRLADAFAIIRQKFNSLAIDNLTRLGNMVKDLSNGKDESVDDLDNLTKEELIARLREKMK